jgi:hypothetical protein
MHPKYLPQYTYMHIALAPSRKYHFFNSNNGGWSPTGSTWHFGHQLAYCTFPGDYENGEFGGMMIGREIEVLGENLPQCHVAHQKSHMTSPGANPSRRGGKLATNRVIYGTA